MRRLTRHIPCRLSPSALQPQHSHFSPSSLSRIPSRKLVAASRCKSPRQRCSSPPRTPPASILSSFYNHGPTQHSQGGSQVLPRPKSFQVFRELTEISSSLLGTVQFPRCSSATGAASVWDRWGGTGTPVPLPAENGAHPIKPQLERGAGFTPRTAIAASRECRHRPVPHSSGSGSGAAAHAALWVPPRPRGPCAPLSPPAAPEGTVPCPSQGIVPILAQGRGGESDPAFCRAGTGLGTEPQPGRLVPGQQLSLAIPAAPGAKTAWGIASDHSHQVSDGSP
ncbi:uncharacterized protein LOC135442279 [Zonotrichia leucophrys gambelii]|uniref:uncharacterized protein LOC135442279 n=1 Tax=Zonotrichia leucophrys gambelii TaxID=257770 RepID=UPI00314020E3